MEIGMILDLATLAVVAAWCWAAWRERRGGRTGGGEDPGGGGAGAPPPDPGQSDEERRLREGFANLMAYRGPVTDKEERE